VPLYRGARLGAQLNFGGNGGAINGSTYREHLRHWRNVDALLKCRVGQVDSVSLHPSARGRGGRTCRRQLGSSSAYTQVKRRAIVRGSQLFAQRAVFQYLRTGAGRPFDATNNPIPAMDAVPGYTSRSSARLQPDRLLGRRLEQRRRPSLRRQRAGSDEVASRSPTVLYDARAIAATLVSGLHSGPPPSSSDRRIASGAQHPYKSWQAWLPLSLTLLFVGPTRPSSGRRHAARGQRQAAAGARPGTR
jgi:hypothetical protein